MSPRPLSAVAPCWRWHRAPAAGRGRGVTPQCGGPCRRASSGQFPRRARAPSPSPPACRRGRPGQDASAVRWSWERPPELVWPDPRRCLGWAATTLRFLLPPAPRSPTAVQPGTARHGSAWHCSARHGSARHGSALLSPARLSLAWLSLAWLGTAQPGTAQPSTAQPGTAQPGTAHPGSAHPGMAQPGTSQPGTAQLGTAQPGSAQPGTAQPGFGPIHLNPSPAQLSRCLPVPPVSQRRRGALERVPRGMLEALGDSQLSRRVLCSPSCP